MGSLSIAIVGAGYMAEEHAKAFASIPGVSVSGVCSRRRQRAEALARKYGAKAFDDIEELFEGTRADGVLIAVDETSARDVCRRVFNFPWACLLEKPVGIDAVEAKEILEYSLTAGGRAFVALNRRSYGSTRRALQELEAGDGPRLISVLDQQSFDSARASGKPEAVVERYMYANSIHLIDLFTVFGRGEVESVHRVVPWAAHQPQHVVSVIRFSSGDSGVYQAVWDGPGPWAVSVTNRLLRAEMRPMEKLGLQRLGTRALEEVPQDQRDLDFKPGLRWQAEQFVAGIAGKGCSLATLQDATRSMQLVAEIYGHRA
jgi:predicted dehydrogenase